MTGHKELLLLDQWFGGLSPKGSFPADKKPFLIIPEEAGPEEIRGAEVLYAHVECLEGEMVDFTFIVHPGDLSQIGLCEVYADVPGHIVSSQRDNPNFNADYIEYLKLSDLPPHQTLDPLRHVLEPLARERGVSLDDPEYEYFTRGYDDPLALNLEKTERGWVWRAGGSTANELERAYQTYLKLVGDEGTMRDFLGLALTGMVETLQTEMTTLSKYCQEKEDALLGILDPGFTEADMPILVDEEDPDGGVDKFFRKRTYRIPADQAEQFFLDKPVDIVANALGELEKTETRDSRSMRVAGVEEGEYERRVHAWGRALVLMPKYGERPAYNEIELFDLNIDGDSITLKLSLGHGNRLQAMLKAYGKQANLALGQYLSSKEGLMTMGKILRGVNTTMLEGSGFYFTAEEIPFDDDSKMTASPVMVFTCSAKGELTEETVKNAYLVGARTWEIMSNFLHLFYDALTSDQEVRI